MGRNRPGFWGITARGQPTTWGLLDPGRMIRVAGGGTRQGAMAAIVARLFCFDKGGRQGDVGRPGWRLQPDENGLYLQVVQGMRVCVTIGYIGK